MHPCYNMLYLVLKFTYMLRLLLQPSSGSCTGIFGIIQQVPKLHKSNHLALQRISQALFLNNQPDALIIPILFCYKTLHVSDIFSDHHQEFSTVHSALVILCRCLMTASKQSQDGTELLPIIRSFPRYCHTTMQIRYAIRYFHTSL
jgi:hypothetical protein